MIREEELTLREFLGVKIGISRWSQEASREQVVVNEERICLTEL